MTTRRLDPRNLTAQLRYRGGGNPPGAIPDSAVSNCFPGLEFDFRNVWRRILVGIVLHEARHFVVDVDDRKYARLRHHWLMRIDGQPTCTTASGPQIPGQDVLDLMTASDPHGVAFLEWSNSLATVLRKAGRTVACQFSAEASQMQPDPATTDVITVRLRVRRFFDHDPRRPARAQTSATITRELASPGELTQSLCSPWQSDFRECGCYYWAASRPDYVNVEQGPDGASIGHNWLQKDRTSDTPKEYLTDGTDSRLVSYDELFEAWEKKLRFDVRGEDTE